MTLHQTMNSLAETFAHELLRAIRGASLADILAETSAGHATRRGPGRPRKEAHASVGAKPRAKRGRVRRTPDDLQKLVGRIIEVVKANRKGINAEHLREALKCRARSFPSRSGWRSRARRSRRRGRSDPRRTSRPNRDSCIAARVRRRNVR